MILSALAASLGFCVENILVLPGGKGNSSQQMGKHGRQQLRKCIYVWKMERSQTPPISTESIKSGQSRIGCAPCSVFSPGRLNDEI